MKKIRISVIGLGHLGSIHARIYSKLKACNLIGLCDIDEKRGLPLSKELNVPFYSNYKDLFKRAKPDAVSIVTPTISHYEISRYFLKNLVHILIEKPITRTLQEARSLIKLADAHKLILQVGHVERFNSAIQAIEKISSEPRFIEVHRLGPFTPRVKDVGVVLDLMIHDIDIILGLTKSKVKDIDAIGMKVLTKHEDIANARLRFQNGTVCDLTASRVTNDVMRKIRIFQKDCYISLDYVNQEAIIYKKDSDRIVSKQINIKKDMPLKKELLSFVDCVRYNKRPIVSGREAYEALKLAIRILKKIHR